MNNVAKISTLIVDDEPVARAGMRHMLAEVEWIECIGEAANGPDAIETGSGTGLRRLRERMRWLYGERARLDLISEPGSGFAATLTLPQVIADE